MVFCERPNGAVLGVREGRHPRLPQAGDHRDRGSGETAPQQVVSTAVLEDAEEPELLAPRACRADLVESGHGAAHGLPVPTAGEPRRRRPRDVVDDRLALADRFGLSLGFHACSQDDYLTIIAGYAAHHGLAFEADDALAWSKQRGSRSGRVAWQFVNELAGRAGKTL